MCTRDSGPYEVKNGRWQSEKRMPGNTIACGKVKNMCRQMHVWASGLNFFVNLSGLDKALKSEKISSSIVMFMKAMIPGTRSRSISTACVLDFDPPANEANERII